MDSPDGVSATAKVSWELRALWATTGRPINSLTRDVVSRLLADLDRESKITGRCTDDMGRARTILWDALAVLNNRIGN